MEIERASSKSNCGRKLRLIAVALAIAAAGSLSGQTGAQQGGVAAPPDNALSTLPQFEVASIRPSGPKQNEMNGFYSHPGGRVACNGCFVQYLIMVAFDVQRWQISGGPAWIMIGGARFDLQAKPPESLESSKMESCDSEEPSQRRAT
ncbi:MAG: TIGR03435 family protein [Terracidiphilus sp.]